MDSNLKLVRLLKISRCKFLNYRDHAQPSFYLAVWLTDKKKKSSQINNYSIIHFFVNEPNC